MLKKLVEPAIFACVGLTASAVHYVSAILYIEGFGLPAWLANIFAFATAFPVSYLGHAFLTFSARRYGRETAATQQSFRRFLVVAVTGFAINQASVLIFVETLHYPPRIVMAVAIAGVAIFLYAAGKIWAFRGKPA
jgi:putative flippase GtrA